MALALNLNVTGAMNVALKTVTDESNLAREVEKIREELGLLEVKWPSASQLPYWGYLHVNGTVHVKRFYDIEEIKDAQESPFVHKVFGPFYCTNTKEAFIVLENYFTSHF